MFGIGLQEMFVIFAVALIVVGPDKLPGLARSLAKGFVEIRKTLEQAKENLTQENEMLESVKKDLKDTSESMRDKMIGSEQESWRRAAGPSRKSDDEVIDMVEFQPASDNIQNQKEQPKNASATIASSQQTKELEETSASPVVEYCNQSGDREGETSEKMTKP